MSSNEKKRDHKVSFFVCGIFMGSICLLYAFFVAIVKLLRTNQMHITAHKTYKTLIYSIIIR